ncbi:MAG: TIGR03862 family flavoprotein [Bacteroidetes bacterium]|nr:TIGR03862 family flavoprotein [Bacteroidota bacterium]
MKKSIAIIGSGPASLILAATLDEALFDIVVYERNFAPARKFLVAGDGGFNLTHSEDMEQLITRYTPSIYLEKCLRSFTNIDLQKWLKQLHIETFIGSSKRVFPVKGIKPIDVLNAILYKLKSRNVRINTKHEWKGWNNKNELLFRNEEKEFVVNHDIVVFALGGASWSKTGSDGKWTAYFNEKGIETIPFQPSNCAFAINWDKDFIAKAEGQPLKNISVMCSKKEKKGEIVLTQFGVEGGAVYALSPEIRKQLEENTTATIFIDLKPTLTKETIFEKLNSAMNRTISKTLQNEIKLNELQIALLKSVLPKEDFVNPINLALRIKQLPLLITRMASIEDAISTVGGIALQETDENFQLTKLPNHYAIGEMLNWDAPTGGYLLQACFSMGYYLANLLNAKNN